MDMLEGLNDEQKAAVTHQAGPLLIVAGAGTGKTTVITKRLAWLIDSGQAKPDSILALTFTDKAAGEMEERLDKLLPYGYVDLWVSTFHAFGERLLQNHALDIGVPYDFKILTETEQWMLVRRHLDRFSLHYYRPLGNPTKFIHALLRHFSRAKDEAIYPDDYLKYAEQRRLDQDGERTRTARRPKRTSPGAASPTPADANETARLEEVANAYHTYQQLLLEANALDFGDLMNYTLKLFRSRPEVLARYRAQFHYILVDEFQDTNWVQYELVKLLAAPGNNLTVVGDDDQAIYRFRGASMSNILQFKRDYRAAVEVVLTQNYRSAQNILDLAYRFIQHNNPNRLEVQLGAGEEGRPRLTKALTAAEPRVADLAHLHGRSADDEFRLVVDKIRQLKAVDPEARWNDFAVLARTNEQVSQFDAALERAGLPHQSVSSKGLYAKPVIVDALCYLKLLDNYHESPALWRVLNFPFWHLAPRDLVELSHLANKKSWSLFEALERAALLASLSPETRAGVGQVLKYLGEHSVFARDHRPTELFVKALNDIGYTTFVEAQGEERARLAFSFLNQLYRRMQRWEETQLDPRLQDFMPAMAYELESGEAGDVAVDLESGPEVIPVMTVHSAKGLEFAYVFVVNMVERRFPTIERREPIELPAALIKEMVTSGDAHLEEERRLLYVAMTRAKRGLFFTSAEDYGGARRKKISPFLLELGLTLSPPSERDHDFAGVARGTGSEDRLGGVMADYLPTEFSFTSLKAYETCPFQYRYAHVLKVPVWGRWTFSFGKSMHRTLERFFTLLLERQNATQTPLFGGAEEPARTWPTLDDLLALYEASWIDEWYETKEHARRYREAGRRMLKEFFQRYDGHWPDTIAVEQGFSLKFGPYTLKGQMDRIDVRDGGIEIVDYKTNETVPEKLSASQKEQLLIYQLAAETVRGKEPVVLTYYYLTSNKPLSFRGSPEELQALQRKIKQTMADIRQGDFRADPSPQKCRQCDYKLICPFSQA